MKSAKFFLVAIVFIAFNSLQAQVKTTMTFPDWGVAGQDDATYYYIPGAETYYDLQNKEYVYMQDGKWIRTSTIPITYANYDLYNGYKVVLTDKNEPFADYENMRIKYARDFKGEPQKTYKVKKTKSGKMKIKER